MLSASVTGRFPIFYCQVFAEYENCVQISQVLHSLHPTNSPQEMKPPPDSSVPAHCTGPWPAGQPSIRGRGRRQSSASWPGQPRHLQGGVTVCKKPPSPGAASASGKGACLTPCPSSAARAGARKFTTQTRSTCPAMVNPSAAPSTLRRKRCCCRGRRIEDSTAHGWGGNAILESASMTQILAQSC